VFALRSVAGADPQPKLLASPDKKLVANIIAVGKEKGLEWYESRIEVRRHDGTLLSGQDFSSSDGDHGYGADLASWTPDSRFFVARMRSSGGHSPAYAPVVFWSRKRNCFYQLDDYTGDISFSVSAPDKVSLSTWPGMKPVTVSLHLVKGDQISKLH